MRVAITDNFFGQPLALDLVMFGAVQVLKYLALAVRPVSSLHANGQVVVLGNGAEVVRHLTQVARTVGDEDHGLRAWARIGMDAQFRCRAAGEQLRGEKCQQWDNESSHHKS